MRRSTMRMISMILMLVLTLTSVDVSAFAAELSASSDVSIAYEERIGEAGVDAEALTEAKELMTESGEVVAKETESGEVATKEAESEVISEEATDMDVVGEEELPTTRVQVTGDRIIKYKKNYKSVSDDVTVYPVLVGMIVDKLDARTVQSATLSINGLELPAESIYSNVLDFHGADWTTNEDYTVLTVSALVNEATIMSLENKTNVPVDVAVEYVKHNDISWEPELITCFTASTTLDFVTEDTSVFENMDTMDLAINSMAIFDRIPLGASVKEVNLVDSQNNRYPFRTNYCSSDEYNVRFSRAYPTIVVKAPGSDDTCRITSEFGNDRCYTWSGTTPLVAKGLYDLEITDENNKRIIHKNAVNIEEGMEVLPDSQAIVQPTYYITADPYNQSTQPNAKPFIYYALPEASSNTTINVCEIYVDGIKGNDYSETRSNALTANAYGSIQGDYPCRIVKTTISETTDGEFDTILTEGDHTFRIVLEEYDSKTGKARYYSHSGSFKIAPTPKKEYYVNAWMSYPINNEDKQYAYFDIDTELPEDEDLGKPKLVSQSDPTKEFELIHHKVYNRYSTNSSTRVYNKFKFAGIDTIGDLELDSRDCSPFILGKATGLYVEYKAPVDRLIDGEKYSFVYTSNKGKKYVVKDILMMPGNKLVINSVFPVTVGKYRCDSFGDYIAIVVYGKNIPDTLIPKFYGSHDSVGGFSTVVGTYDPADPNCAMSPDLGDGRVYKIRKEAGMRGEPSGDVYFTYNSADVLYKSSRTDDPVDSAGSLVGKKFSYQTNPVINVLYSNSSTKKICRVFLSSDFVTSKGMNVGDFVRLSSIIWTYPAGAGSPQRNYKFFTGVLDISTNGSYYIDVPASDSFFTTINQAGYATVDIDGGYSFSVDGNTSLKMLSNLSPNSAWKIRSTSDMTVLLEGQKGTNVISKSDLNFLSLQSHVLVELYDDKGNCTNSYYAIFNPVASDIITYVNDGNYTGDTVHNPNHILKGDKITLESPTRENYTFDGWYSESTFKNKVTEITSAGGRNITLYAKWTADEYTIKYIATAGTVEKQIKYDEGLPQFDTCDPALVAEGYEITGWAKVNNGEDVLEGLEEKTVRGLLTVVTPVDKTITLYAKEALKQYKIVYVTNGAEVSGAWPKNFTMETDDILLPTISDASITNKGFTFDGWYRDYNYENKITKISKGTKSDVVVLAKFVPARYTLKFDANVDSFAGLKLTSSATINDAEYSYGEVVTLPANVYKVTNAENVKFTFAGWATEPTGAVKYADKSIVSFDKTAAAADTVTLYAVYKNEFALSYNGLEGVKPVELPNKYTYGKALTLPTPVKDGFDFLGWYDGAGKKVTSISNKSVGDITLYANWREKTYKLTLNPNGGKGKTLTIPVAYNGLIDLSVYSDYTKTGYDFVGWSYNDSLCGTFSPATYGDIFGKTGSKITLKALYDAKAFNIVYDTNGGVALADKMYTYSSKEEEIDVPVRAGYTFVGWYFDTKYKKAAGKYNASTGKYMLKKSVLGDEHGNIVLHAKWIANYTVVLVNTNNGATKEYEGYKYLTAKALPANTFTLDGKTVSGWSLVDGSTDIDYALNQSVDGSSNLTVESGKLLLKLYTVWNTPALVLNANGGCFTDAVGTIRKEYTVGTAKDFNALKSILPSEPVAENPSLPTNPTRQGYVFDGWYFDKGCTKKGSIKTTDKNDIQLFAKWKPSGKYIITFKKGDESGYYNSYTQEIPYGKTVALAKNTFDSKGALFEGWSMTDPTTDMSATVDYKNLQKVTDLGNIYLYPMYSESFTISFDLNTDDVSAVDGVRTSYTYKYGAEISPALFAKLSVPSRTGYVFAGWCTDVEGKKTFKKISRTQSGDITLYAKWTPAKYKVNFDSNVPYGSTLKGKMKAQTLTYTKSTALSKIGYSINGYKFAGWSAVRGGAVVYANAAKIADISGAYPVNGEVTLYAVWTPNEYKITYKNMDGFVNPNASTYTPYGVTVLASPSKLGYTFEGWYLDKNFKNQIVAIKPGTTGNKTVYAKWKAIREAN